MVKQKILLKKIKLDFIHNAENSIALSKQILACMNIDYKKKMKYLINLKILLFAILSSITGRKN